MNLGNTGPWLLLMNKLVAFSKWIESTYSFYLGKIPGDVRCPY